MKRHEPTFTREEEREAVAKIKAILRTWPRRKR